MRRGANAASPIRASTALPGQSTPGNPAPTCLVHPVSLSVGTGASAAESSISAMARQENAHFYAFAQKSANEQESQVRGKQWFTADALGGPSAAPLLARSGWPLCCN